MKNLTRSGLPWARFILRHRKALLAVFVILTAFWGYQVQTLSVSKDVNALFPPHHPNMALNRTFKKMLAGPDTLICVLEVKNGDIYTQEALSKIQALTRAVMNLPGCDASDIKSITETSVKHMEATAWGVETNPVIFPSMPKTPEAFFRLRKRVETDPGIRGVFVAYDGSAAAIMAKWKKGDDLGRLYQDLSRLTQTRSSDQYQVHFAGAPALGANLIHLTGQIKTAVIWMVAALVILLAVYLRSITGVLICLVALVLGIVWAAGLAAFTGISISFLAIVWVFFLCGISTAFAGFCFNRYQRSCSHIREKQLALETAFGQLMLPVAAGLAAFGICTMVLLTSDVPLLAQTGGLGGCWALANLMTVLVFIPNVLSFLPVPRSVEHKSRARTQATGIPVVVVLGIVLMIVAGGGFCASRLTVGDNEPGSAFFFPDNPYNRAFSIFNEKFIGAYNLTIVVEGKEKGALNHAESMELVSCFQNHMENETDARACISMAMMMKVLSRVYHEGNPKWAVIPRDKRERSTLGGAIKMGGTAGKWMDDTWTNGSIQAMYGSDSHSLIKNRVSKAQAFILEHPSDKLQFRLFAGFLGAIAAMNDAGQYAYWISFIGALAVAVFSGIFLFRSVGPGMVIFLSVITGQALVWMVMALRGIAVSIHIVPAVPFSMGFSAALVICLMAFSQTSFPDFPRTLAGRKSAVRSLAGPVAVMGGILLVMMLPWAWLDLKFMAEAGAVLAVSILMQTAVAVLLLPLLVDFYTLEMDSKTNPQH